MADAQAAGEGLLCTTYWFAPLLPTKRPQATLSAVNESSDSDRPLAVPPIAWANVASLDAVIVGMVWLGTFTIQFCGRFPLTYEMSIIGLSIWLVYTADRLFDAARLNPDRPHTLRHRFHKEHGGKLFLIWLAALALDALLIVRFSTDSQLRWGFAAVAIAIAYVTAAQLCQPLGRWFPKELQVGIVFAFGTSLVAWSDPKTPDTAPLLASVVLVAMLFALNCVCVGLLEIEMDSGQGFISLVRQLSGPRETLMIGIVLHGLLSIGVGLSGGIPLMVAGCLVASDLLLLGLVLVTRRQQPSDSRWSQASLRFRSVGFRPPVVFADLALIVPPACWLAAMTIR